MELDRKTLGRSKLKLSVLGFGGTGLGNMYVAMSERSAIDTLSAAYAAGMRYYDTAPLYGHGLSELRLCLSHWGIHLLFTKSGGKRSSAASTRPSTTIKLSWDPRPRGLCGELTL